MTTERIYSEVMKLLEGAGVDEPHVRVKRVVRRNSSVVGYSITVFTFYRKGSRRHIFRVGNDMKIPRRKIIRAAEEHIHTGALKVFSDMIRSENKPAAREVREYFDSHYLSFFLGYNADGARYTVDASSNAMRPVTIGLGTMDVTVDQAKRLADLLMEFHMEAL